jgi:hypothetical protein
LLNDVVDLESDFLAFIFIKELAEEFASSGLWIVPDIVDLVFNPNLLSRGPWKHRHHSVSELFG